MNKCPVPISHTAWLYVLLFIVTISPIASGQTPAKKGFHYRKDTVDIDILRRHAQELKDRNHHDYSVQQHRAETTRDLLTQLSKDRQQFERRMKILLSDDDGKRIGHDPVGLRRYADIQDHPGVTTKQIDKRQRDVAFILQSLQVAPDLIEGGYLLDEKLQEELIAAYFWAKERTAQMATQTHELDNIVADAPKDIDWAKAATLKAALDHFRSYLVRLSDEASEFARQVTKEKSKQILVDAAILTELQNAKAKAEQRLAEASMALERQRIDYKTRLAEARKKNDADRTRMEIELKDARAENTHLRREADARRHAGNVHSEVKQEKIIADADRERKVALAKSDEVRNLLAPFLDDGYWQPGKAKGSFDKGPVSYAALRSTGALRPTVGGLHKLLKLGRYKRDRERTRWGYPQRLNKLSAGQRDQLKRAQEYLIDLGDVMVEIGMLAP